MRRSTVMFLAATFIVSACSTGGNVFDLGVGDCFDDPETASEVVSDVPVVPCSEAHDNEVFYEFDMSDTVFPGADAALQSSALRCLDEFEGFVGRSYAESDLDLYPITPTAQSWDEGDRVVYCVLYAVDLSKLTGSMRGSGR